ncbi:hypothetical protein GOBAR_DD06769 [Gossypium barbadense]|nr:hypothetical protein GOBAR_DD06769 [Gossypium barbadense]
MGGAYLISGTSDPYLVGASGDPYLIGGTSGQFLAYLIASAKIDKRCGRRISKLFYKFPISTDPIKFTEMEFIDDEYMETMAALYCGNRSNQNTLIQLFAELASVEPTEDTHSISQSTVRGIDIDLNAAPETDVVGGDVYNISDPSNHEVDSDSDPDMDYVQDDIEDDGVIDDGNINASSIGN